MLEVSSLKPLAGESKGFAFWVELVAPGLPSAGYLSYVACKLLHRSGVLRRAHPKGSGCRLTYALTAPPAQTGLAKPPVVTTSESNGKQDQVS
ncbi:hypothetical protein MTR67_035082 [Solanum verrucosum]|uniref:Uncharacterized protein n=1 Tax=Solanum verrucosum TaxID=315347 RepID=A0AAF0U9B7_SOLVR|nr:hypothetical protein MTR67_035082 [Solanum verrucosum]